jgi:hypothetical protein
LDWYLDDPTSSTVARLVLADLREHCFLPVLIYTDQQDAAEAEVPHLPVPFNRCRFFDKDSTDPTALTDELRAWYEGSMSARLCTAWRNGRHRALEQGAYELDALEGEDFYRTLQHILVMDTGMTPDVDHALEFLERPHADLDAIYVASLDGKENRFLTISTSNAIAVPGYLLFLQNRTLMAQPFDFSDATLKGEPLAIAQDVHFEDSLASHYFALRISGNRLDPQRSVAATVEMNAIFEPSGDHRGLILS